MCARRLVVGGLAPVRRGGGRVGTRPAQRGASPRACRGGPAGRWSRLRRCRSRPTSWRRADRGARCWRHRLRPCRRSRAAAATLSDSPGPPPASATSSTASPTTSSTGEPAARRHRCASTGPARHLGSDRPAAMPLGVDARPASPGGTGRRPGSTSTALGGGRCPSGPVGERAPRAEGRAGHPDPGARGGGRRRRLVVAVGARPSPSSRTTSSVAAGAVGRSPPCWRHRPCRRGPSSRHRGSALARDAIKLSATQVLEIPLPSQRSGWTTGAAAAERAHMAADAGDPSGWHDRARSSSAQAMTDAYGSSAAVLAWWLDRLPAWR